MTPRDNEILTRVGPGTPGGELLRRYWWPIWFSELTTDKPVPVRLLGEDFVLFRDGAGRVGLVGKSCAHRGASMALGRVEERGLRCCYHGWLYGADGRCLEMPAEPPESRLHEEVCIPAGVAEELSGLVFAYIGPQPAPLLPRYDLLVEENADRTVWAADDYCNWAQRAENGVDPYHSMSLHAGVYPTIALRRPEADWTETPYGFRMTSQYPGGALNIFHSIFPSHTRRTNARVGTAVSNFLHLRVPIDDTLTRTYYVKTTACAEGAAPSLTTRGWKPTTPGVYDQVEDGWWGIASHDQDRAAQESQGLIADRSQEFLGTSDRGIVLWRKAFFDGVAAVAAGRDPIGVIRDPAENEQILFDAGKNFSDVDKPAPKGALVDSE